MRPIGLARRPEAALLGLLLVSYSYFYQSGGWNQNSRFDLTRSLVEERSVRIDRYHKNTGDKARHGEHFYSDKAPGLSALAVPAYALVRALAESEEPGPGFVTTAAYLCTLSAVALPSALGAVALQALLGVLGLSAPARTVVTLAYALGTLAFPYSTLFYGHQLAAALGFGGFALLAGARQRALRSGPALFAGAGAMLGGCLAVEYVAVLAVAPVCAYAAHSARPVRRLAPFALGLAVPLVGLAAYHLAAFGSPLALPYEFSTQEDRHQGFFMGLGAPELAVLRELLIGSRRGLLYSAPWLALALPGLLALSRRPDWRAEAAVCGSVAALFLCMNASLVDWDGGQTMGPRYLVPALPFLAFAVGGLARPRAGRRTSARALAARAVGSGLALAAIAYSMLLMLAATAVRPEVPGYVQEPFFGYLLPLVRKGRLAVSGMRFDAYLNDPTGAHHAWNLGQLLGLDGHASLVPLGIAAAAAGAWLARTCRRGGGRVEPGSTAS